MARIEAPAEGESPRKQLLPAACRHRAALDPTEVDRCLVLVDLAQTREYTEATLSCEESPVFDIAADDGLAVPESCFELRERCTFLAQ